MTVCALSSLFSLVCQCFKLEGGREWKNADVTFTQDCATVQSKCDDSCGVAPISLNLKKTLRRRAASEKQKVLLFSLMK